MSRVLKATNQNIIKHPNPMLSGCWHTAAVHHYVTSTGNTQMHGSVRNIVMVFATPAITCGFDLIHRHVIEYRKIWPNQCLLKLQGVFNVQEFLNIHANQNSTTTCDYHNNINWVIYVKLYMHITHTNTQTQASNKWLVWHYVFCALISASDIWRHHEFSALKYITNMVHHYVLRLNGIYFILFRI